MSKKITDCFNEVGLFNPQCVWLTNWLLQIIKHRDGRGHNILPPTQGGFFLVWSNFWVLPLPESSGGGGWCWWLSWWLNPCCWPLSPPAASDLLFAKNSGRRVCFLCEGLDLWATLFEHRRRQGSFFGPEFCEVPFILLFSSEKQDNQTRSCFWQFQIRNLRERLVRRIREQPSKFYVSSTAEYQNLRDCDLQPVPQPTQDCRRPASGFWTRPQKFCSPPQPTWSRHCLEPVAKTLFLHQEKIPMPTQRATIRTRQMPPCPAKKSRKIRRTMHHLVAGITCQTMVAFPSEPMCQQPSKRTTGWKKWIMFCFRCLTWNAAEKAWSLFAVKHITQLGAKACDTRWRNKWKNKSSAEVGALVCCSLNPKLLWIILHQEPAFWQSPIVCWKCWAASRRF